jgi:hypothetical protein
MTWDSWRHAAQQLLLVAGGKCATSHRPQPSPAQQQEAAEQKHCANHNGKRGVQSGTEIARMDDLVQGAHRKCHTYSETEHTENCSYRAHNFMPRPVAGIDREQISLS